MPGEKNYIIYVYHLYIKYLQICIYHIYFQNIIRLIDFSWDSLYSLRFTTKYIQVLAQYFIKSLSVLIVAISFAKSIYNRNIRAM